MERRVDGRWWPATWLLLLGLLASGVAAAVVGRAEAAPGTDRLAAGETLTAGQGLAAPDLRTALTLQQDGDLVVGVGSTTRWRSGTTGHPGSTLRMQADGNLVLLSADGTPLWSTATWGNPGAVAVVRDPGDLAIVDAEGITLWATDTADRLDPGTILLPRRDLRSPDGRVSLTMQTDGNVVLRGPDGRPSWTTGTGNHPGAHLALQRDGNLVVKDVDGTALWNAKTSGRPDVAARLRNSGDLAIVDPTGRAAWTSGTAFRLDPGQSLRSRARLRSLDGVYTATMQPDGTLLLARRGTPYWFTRSQSPGSALVLQPTGDLVLQTRSRGTAWRTATAGHPGALAVLGTDGRLTVRSPSGTVLWASPAGDAQDRSRLPIANRAASRKGADFIKAYEGFRAEPYNDANGHCTVGWGHLIHRGGCTAADKAKHWDTEALFASDLVEHEGRLKRSLPSVPVTQWEYDALVSYVYNRGSITSSSSPSLYAALAARPPRYADVPRIIAGQGGSLCGLQRRRADEAALFDHGDYQRDYPACRASMGWF